MRDNRTFKMVILAIMFALMIAFLFFMPLYAFVPLIILAVFSQIGNIKMAALFGLLFGMASLLSALLLPSTPLYVAFLNPLVSVVPRILVGITAYSVYNGVFRLLGKKHNITDKNIFFSYKGEERRIAARVHYFASVFSGISCAIVNTLLVVGTILILYNGRTFSLEEMSIVMKPVVFIPLIAPNAILEPIITAIVAPPIVTALKHLG